MISEILDFLEYIFSESIILGFNAVLMIWISACWWFKLTRAGWNKSFADILLDSTKITIPKKLSLIKVKELSVAFEENDVNHKYSLGTTFLIYYTLVFKYKILKVYSLTLSAITIILVFFIFAELKEGISILNVIEFLSYCFIPFLLLMFMTLLVKLRYSITLLPVDIFKEKPLLVILLAS